MNKEIKPRNYQKECLIAIDEAIEKGENRALVVMASGLGKTYTAAFAVEKFFRDQPFSRTLVLCHSEKILRQTKDKFKEYFGEEFSYGMYVDRDKTTRPTNFLFATFQTMKGNRKNFLQDEFAYIVVDEAHHSHACTYFPTIRYFQSDFLLGLTATPDRLDGQKIEEIYGEPVYELGFVEAAKRGLIAECDYRLVLDDLSQERLDEYLASDEKISINQLNRTLFIEKRDEEIVRLIREYSAEVKNPKTMIFCRTITHARRITRIMGDDVALVHKKNSDSANDRALAAFRDGEISTIISVDMLNEGVDIPDANVIVFLRNTVSPVVFYQQLGRGTRLSEGKEKALILDFVNNCERIKMILELKQEIDDFEVYPPHSDDGTRGDSDVDAEEKFTLNIATPIFATRMVSIVDLLEKAEKGLGWTDEELLNAFSAKAEKVGHTPTMVDIQGDSTMASPATYIKRFGSMAIVARKCGLTPNRGEWDDVADDVLLSLMLEKSKDGIMPTYQEVKDDPDMPYPEVYKRRFGTWYELSKKLNLTISRIQVGRNEKLSKAELINIMQYEASQNGGIALSRAEFAARLDLPAPDAYIKAFGSWNNAIVAADLEVRQDVTSDELALQRLQDKATQLGRTPTRTDVDNDKTMLSSQTYANRFGTFSNALKKANLKTKNRPGLVLTAEDKNSLEQQMLIDLQQLAYDLDRVPTQNDLQAKKQTPSSATYARHFGSYKNALRLTGLIFDKMTPEQVLLDKLKELAAENGGIINGRILKTAGWRFPSLRTIEKVFGGLRIAKQRAGLS